MFPEPFVFTYNGRKLGVFAIKLLTFDSIHQSAYFQAVECCSARLKATEKPALVASTKSCLAKGTPRSSLVTFQASILKTSSQTVFRR